MTGSNDYRTLQQAGQPGNSFAPANRSTSDLCVPGGSGGPYRRAGMGSRFAPLGQAMNATASDSVSRIGFPVPAVVGVIETHSPLAGVKAKLTSNCSVWLADGESFAPSILNLLRSMQKEPFIRSWGFPRPWFRRAARIRDSSRRRRVALPGRDAALA